MAVVAIDVDTESVDTETRASKSALAPESLLAMVLDRTTDGVLVANSGVIEYVNQPLLHLFGYEAAQLVGEPIGILVPEAQRDKHQQLLDHYRDAPSPRSMGRDDLDIEGRRSDGTCFSIDVQLTPIPGSALVVAIVRDVTQQRNAAVDLAIARLDLTSAVSKIGFLQQSLDLVVQSLFGLGTSIAAGASNEALLRERLAGAMRGIDEVIEAVQQRRVSAGP